MTARRVIVGGIFVLIAVIGAAALLAPFLGGWGAVISIMMIGVVGTVAGFAAIPLAMLAGRPALRPGAIGGMIVLGIEALLLCALSMTTHNFWLELSLTSAVLAGAIPMLLAVASLFVLAWRPMRAAAIVCLGIAGISYLLVIIACVALVVGSMPGPRFGFEEVLAVGVYVALAGMLGLAASTRRADEPATPGVICVLAPVTALVITLALIVAYANQWSASEQKRLEGLAALAWPVAAGISIWRVMRLARLRDLPALLPIAFVATTIVGGALLSWGLEIDNQITVALGASSLVLAACLGVAVAMLAWLQRRVDTVERMASVAPGSLPCPRCRGSIEVRPGAGQCPACGLRYKLSLEAPLCRRCRHDLAHVLSAVCPECGEPVRQSVTVS